MDIAIIGFSSSCKDAPWDDPSWLKWGLVNHPEYWAKMDLLFDIHQEEDDEHKEVLRERAERARDAEIPIYMHEKYYDWVHRYPFERVSPHYFDSSMSYMLALAISENPKRIGLWGINMSDEYGHQRSNMEFWLGYAKGKGIEILISDDSPLLKNKVNYGFKEWRLPPIQN